MSLKSSGIIPLSLRMPHGRDREVLATCAMLPITPRQEVDLARESTFALCTRPLPLQRGYLYTATDSACPTSTVPSDATTSALPTSSHSTCTPFAVLRSMVWRRWLDV